MAEQPATLKAILNQPPAALASVAEAVRRKAPSVVLFAARGTSDHAALYGKYLVETRLGLAAGLASPSVFTAYDARPDLDRVLFIAVSQSGASDDLVRSAEAARAAGALTVAVTNAPGSPLSTACELHLDVLAGHERAVAATKSFTAQLLTLWALVRKVRGDDLDEGRAVPDACASALEEDLTREVASYLRFADRLFVVGRGYGFPTALEAALKLQETCGLFAHGYSGADVLHGPLAAAGSDVPLVAFVPEGRSTRSVHDVVDAAQRRRSPVITIGALHPRAAPARHIPTRHRLPEELAPVADVVLAQGIARFMALDRGIDPDRPLGLEKVTSTL